MAHIVPACRCAVGLVFAAAIVGKLRGRTHVAGFVAAAGRLGPGWLVARVPAGVPAGAVVTAEAAVPVLPITAWTGFVLAGLLASTFAAVVLTALRRPDRAPCHCFGGSARPAGGVHLVRNGVLAAAAGLGPAADAVAAGPLEPAGAVIAVVAGAVVAAVVVTADDVAELFRPVVPADLHRATKGSVR
jgi:hypothetical protein